MKNILLQAKQAAREASALTTEIKNAALLCMADALEENADEILQANEIDLLAAEGVLPDVMLDRLRLTKARIEGMAKGVREVVALPDPVGVSLEKNLLANGLTVERYAYLWALSGLSTKVVPT